MASLWFEQRLACGPSLCAIRSVKVRQGLEPACEGFGKAHHR